jgi:uncharacterized protein YciI
MLVTILCTFAPGAYAHARQLRLEHYAFLRELKQSIVEGGPLLGPDGVPSGMLMVLEADSLEAARAFIAREPYNAHGFFESVAILHWSHVIPEPHEGYIETEYRKETEARGYSPASLPLSS